MREMQMYGNNCNTYLVAGVLPGGKHVIVDPGMVTNEARQPCLRMLMDNMTKDGLKIEDTGLIINTHGHPDHYGASEEIRKVSGAQVCIGEEEMEFLNMMGGELASVVKQMGFDFPELHPDFYLTEGELRLSENLVAQIILTPGHSKGHVSVYWPAEKVFMGGDLVFAGSTGRVDIPGGSGQQLKDSIERIARLDIEYLLTGHQYAAPGIITGRENIQRNFEIIRRSIFPYL